MDFISRLTKYHKLILIRGIICLLVGFGIIIVAFCSIMTIASVRRVNRITLYDFPNSVWECQNPHIHLEVGDVPGKSITGYTIINDKIIAVKLSCVGTGREAILYDTERLDNGSYGEEAELIRALYKCSEKEATLSIERDNIFDNQYQEIVLIRQN